MPKMKGPRNAVHAANTRGAIRLGPAGGVLPRALDPDQSQKESDVSSPRWPPETLVGVPDMMIECEAPATLNRTGAAEFAGRKGATNNRAPPAGPRSTKPSPTLTDKTRAKDVTAAQPCVRAAEFRRGWGVMVWEGPRRSPAICSRKNSFRKVGHTGDRDDGVQCSVPCRVQRADGSL